MAGAALERSATVTLSEETVRAIDEIAGRGTSRSRVIEQAVIEHLDRRRRAKRNARDVEIINRHAARLNREMEDVLAYQIEP